MSENKILGVDDVAKLLANPSAENRADAVSRVGAEFARGSLDEKSRKLALEIFSLVLHDVELRVRQALAESVKDNPSIPHNLANTLAQDVAEVAIPILQNSTVLDDADLMNIVRNFDSDHQAAVAMRPRVSETVADALVETGDEKVVATLVSNDGAQIAEQAMSTVLDKYGDKESVNAPLARRRELPITIAERLVTLVSESLREHIVTHHEISGDLASNLILESRERATIGLLGPDDEKTDVLDLVDQLYDHGRLSSTLILRALCMGDIDFFEASLAKRASIPLTHAYKLIQDEGPLGLQSLFRKAGISLRLLELTKVALKVKRETEYDGGENDRQRFRSRMIERVLTTLETGIDPENLDYFISKLGAEDTGTGAS
ncbi:MAG: DUF2336 domain-containing protein [Sphingomonadales bacterium]